MESDEKLKKAECVSTNNAHYNMPAQISLQNMIFRVQLV